MQNKTAKDKPSDKDTISQLKKDTEKKKVTKLAENEEDWNQPDSEEEEETVKNTAIVAEQSQTKADKPKKLKDLFVDSQPKPKQTKPKQQGEKRKKPMEGGDISKPTYVNTKGTANAQIIDKKREQREDVSKTYTGAQELINKTAEENAKIKPTKNYLEGDLTKKAYTQENLKDFAKPEFRNLKVSENQGEHFVEYNKSEDLFLKNITEKKVELKPVYSMPRVEGAEGEKKERKGRKDYGDRPKYKKYEGGEYQKPHYDDKKEEEEEVDSDGFQVIKKNERKIPTGRYQQNPYRKYPEGGYRGKKEGGERDRNFNFKRGQEPKATEEEKNGNQSNSEEAGNIEEEKPEAKEEGEAPAKVEKKDGATITFKSGGAHKLKDLFA